MGLHCFAPVVSRAYGDLPDDEPPDDDAYPEGQRKLPGNEEEKAEKYYSRAYAYDHLVCKCNIKIDASYFRIDKSFQFSRITSHHIFLFHI